MASADIPSHLITSLPGFSGSLPSKQYSGHISVDDANGRYLHYWFVESEKAPATDPVVLWMNGGPGCSSLDGYLYEHGPLHVDETAPLRAGVPALKLNPDRWNRIANIIFCELSLSLSLARSLSLCVCCLFVSPLARSLSLCVWVCLSLPLMYLLSSYAYYAPMDARRIGFGLA